MLNRVEVRATDGRLHLFKLARGWRRDLEVRVTAHQDGERLKLSFPADRDRLDVTGLDPTRTYDVQVNYRRALLRLRYGAEKLTVAPRASVLRVIVTGSGRCGTMTVARFLDGLTFTDGIEVVARHEPLSEWVVPALADRDFELPLLQQQGASHNIESAPYYSLYPDLIRAETVILLIRDGRRVVQSGLNRGWYASDSIWNRIKPAYGGDQFTQCCRLWHDTTTAVARFAHAVFRIEDLDEDPDQLAAFCAAAKVVNRGRRLSRANRGRTSSAAFVAWTSEQRRQFDDICGGLMDCHYPGWRTDAPRR